MTLQQYFWVISFSLECVEKFWGAWMGMQIKLSLNQIVLCMTIYGKSTWLGVNFG